MNSKRRRRSMIMCMSRGRRSMPSNRNRSGMSSMSCFPGAVICPFLTHTLLVCACGWVGSVCIHIEQMLRSDVSQSSRSSSSNTSSSNTSISSSSSSSSRRGGQGLYYRKRIAQLDGMGGLSTDHPSPRSCPCSCSYPCPCPCPYPCFCSCPCPCPYPDPYPGPCPYPWAWPRREAVYEGCEGGALRPALEGRVEGCGQSVLVQHSGDYHPWYYWWYHWCYWWCHWCYWWCHWYCWWCHWCY
jgi:hypothetical protein